MAYTFLLDGNGDERQIALVRDEIDDVTETGLPISGTDYFVSDERIAARLQSAQDEAASDASETEVRLMACASILDTLATNQAYVLKKKRTMSDEVDGPAVAASIRAHAKSCRVRASDSLTDRRKLTAIEVAKASPMQEPCGGNIALVAVG